MQNKNYKNKLQEMANKLGFEVVEVKNMEDIYKCGGFSMMTDFSNEFLKKNP